MIPLRRVARPGALAASVVGQAVYPADPDGNTAWSGEVQDAGLRFAKTMRERASAAAPLTAGRAPHLDNGDNLGGRLKQSNAAGFSDSWWPSGLGVPASSGSDERLRYAYFPLKSRLVIERDETLTVYDTGDYQFRGAIQVNPHDQTLTFASQRGRVALRELSIVA